MVRDPHHDVLFEAVRIGPVTARNRFYQAPHCNGMGRNYPSPMAAMRGAKAEGGWAVVFTELADIHHTSDSPRNLRLWDEEDFPILAPMVERVHEHGSLAGIQLAHLARIAHQPLFMGMGSVIYVNESNHLHTPRSPSPWRHSVQHNNWSLKASHGAGLWPNSTAAA